MQKRHKIQFPRVSAHDIDQDEAYFFLVESGKRKKIRFHDYNEIYLHQGLYEQLFYERLKCSSPQRVSEALKYAVEQGHGSLSEFRVFDLGAGNGMMGEALKKHGISRLVGLDIIDEAYEAMERDRPGIYDDYYVCDCASLKKGEKEQLELWAFDCLTSVAALGFGDIPPQAFLTAVNIVVARGWIALNIKETFLNKSDTSGFSRMIRELILSEYMELHHLERYCHRFSIEGKPLYYFAIVCRKNTNVPDDFLDFLKK